MKALVKKREFANSNVMGYVTPLFTEENGKWKRIENLKEKFPNNESIFVWKGYDRIDDDFDKDDLFVLNYEYSNKHSSESAGSSQWASTGDDAHAPSDTHFCQIFNSNKPFNPSQGYSFWQRFAPLNNLLFIKSNANIYGPFRYKKTKYDDDEGVNISIHAIAEDKCIYKFTFDDAEKHHQIFHEGTNEYVIDINELINDNQLLKEEIYYGSPSDLIDWAKTVVTSSTFSDETNQLRKITEALNTTSNTEEAKLERLQSHLSNTDDWFSRRLPAFIERYLENSSFGQKKLEEYFNLNEEKLRPNNRIEEVQQLRTDLENLQKKQTESIHDSRISSLPEIDRRFIDILLNDEQTRQKHLKIQKLDQDIYTLEIKNGVQKELIEVRDKELKQKEILKEGLEKSFIKLKEDFRDIDVVRSKFFDIKPYVDWINGIVPTFSDEDYNQKSQQILSLLQVKDSIQPVKEYLNEVRNNLDRLGRPIDFNDLANYLITINQSFLTVFAGLPGVGKTSLVTKLATSVGLKDRFLAISTARGWTSQRDLIGYYNSISSRFQRSKTGLFDVLENCNACVKGKKEIPYWVLLDEANLSPIEHYWSDFIRFTDPESDRSVRIFKGDDQDEMHFGECLKFIATINYDHTTETLSPRLLDRVSVIKLNTPNETIKVEKTSSLPDPNDYYSTSQVSSIFNPTGINYDMNGDNLNLFNQIRSLLQSEDDGLPIVISPRKQKSISKYCMIAQHIFADSINTSFNPLDYAFSQQILPLISGRGENFSRKLNDLYDLISLPLPNSALNLRRIIKNGDNNYYNYRFFI